MKMGIKEFRERIGEVAMGNEVVVVTHHGKRVGRYLPENVRMPRDIDSNDWLKERLATGARWRAATPDWRERLKKFGISDEEIAEMEADDQCS